MSESYESAAPAGIEAPATAATLELAQLVATSGVFPQRGEDWPSSFYLGMILTFAGTNGAFGAPQAQGQLLPVSSNMPLFSLYGTVYGGDSRSTFGLPDLRGRTPLGAGTLGEEEPQTLVLNYIIAAKTGGGAPVGSLALFAGNYTPPGWLRCDGNTYSPDDFPQLFAAIQMTYGGDGGVFAVPDLRERAVLGTGSGPGLPPVALGQIVQGPVTGFGLTPILCVQGVYPDPGTGSFPSAMPFIGQMLAFAGPEVPDGWLPADGRLLPTASYPPLFSLLSNSYGGDGKNSFALPDLRGRMMTGK